MERVLLDRVSQLCMDRDASESTLSSIRLSVLAEAAAILGVPFDPADAADRVIVLSPETFRALDEAWFRIFGTFSDNRVSHQEKTIREQFFANAPHYADRSRLVRFLNVLTKRGSSFLYGLLAVDGFRGVLPAQLRNYACHLDDRLPPVDAAHVAATRELYRDRHVTAGHVLCALLRLYLDRVGERVDRPTRQVAEKALECVRDHVVAEDPVRRCVPRRLARRYRKVLADDALLDAIAFQKLTEYGKVALAKYLP